MAQREPETLEAAQAGVGRRLGRAASAANSARLPLPLLDPEGDRADISPADWRPIKNMLAAASRRLRPPPLRTDARAAARFSSASASPPRSIARSTTAAFPPTARAASQWEGIDGTAIESLGCLPDRRQPGRAVPRAAQEAERRDEPRSHADRDVRPLARQVVLLVRRPAPHRRLRIGARHVLDDDRPISTRPVRVGEAKPLSARPVPLALSQARRRRRPARSDLPLGAILLPAERNSTPPKRSTPWRRCAEGAGIQCQVGKNGRTRRPNRRRTRDRTDRRRWIAEWQPSQESLAGFADRSPASRPRKTRHAASSIP